MLLYLIRQFSLYSLTCMKNPTQLNHEMLFFSEEITELKIQIETGFETQQDLKKSLQQVEGEQYFRVLAYLNFQK